MSFDGPVIYYNNIRSDTTMGRTRASAEDLLSDRERETVALQLPRHSTLRVPDPSTPRASEQVLARAHFYEQGLRSKGLSRLTKHRGMTGVAGGSFVMSHSKSDTKKRQSVCLGTVPCRMTGEA